MIKASSVVRKFYRPATARFSTMVRVPGIGAIAHVRGILSEEEVLRIARENGYERVVFQTQRTHSPENGSGRTDFWKAIA